MSLRQTFRIVGQNGPLARLCGSSFMCLTGQNIISAIVIYYARDYLKGSGGLLAVVTIITTGAVLYVGPFGPAITRRLGKKRGFLVACVTTIGGSLIVLLAGTRVPVALVGLFILGVSSSVSGWACSTR